jgi:hypothetical protein
MPWLVVFLAITPTCRFVVVFDHERALIPAVLAAVHRSEIPAGYRE